MLPSFLTGVVLALGQPPPLVPEDAPVPSPLPLPALPGEAESASAQLPGEETPEPLEVPATLLPTVGPAHGVVEATPGAPVLPERWWLMREVQGTWLGALLDDNRLYLNGWVQTSFTASTDAVSNQPMVWNDRANEFLLQQSWVRLGRRVVTSGTTEPTFGFQADFLIGSDYRFTLPRGLWNSQLLNSTGANNLYGIDAIQHYVSLYIPTLFQGVEFRLGRLYTPVTALESLEGVTNPLLSRSYMFNYDPFTHCGLAAYVTFNREWSAMLMLANGNDVYFGDPSEELRFVGSLKWTAPDGRNILQYDTSMGRGKFVTAFPFSSPTVGALANDPEGKDNLNVPFDGLWTHVFSPRLTYNVEGLFGYQTNVPGIARPNGYGTATWASVMHYVFYTIAPQWSAVFRFENFDDFQGQRTGFEGLYTEATGALIYRPYKGVQIRQELRYDYNAESAPFEGKHQLFTAATDLIVRW
jgi:hypothetical protein